MLDAVSLITVFVIIVTVTVNAVLSMLASVLRMLVMSTTPLRAPLP